MGTLLTSRVPPASTSAEVSPTAGDNVPPCPWASCILLAQGHPGNQLWSHLTGQGSMKQVWTTDAWPYLGLHSRTLTFSEGPPPAPQALPGSSPLTLKVSSLLASRLTPLSHRDSAVCLLCFSGSSPLAHVDTWQVDSQMPGPKIVFTSLFPFPKVHKRRSQEEPSQTTGSTGDVALIPGMWMCGVPWMTSLH